MRPSPRASGRSQSARPRPCPVVRPVPRLYRERFDEDRSGKEMRFRFSFQIQISVHSARSAWTSLLGCGAARVTAILMAATLKTPPTGDGTRLACTFAIAADDPRQREPTGGSRHSDPRHPESSGTLVQELRRLRAIAILMRITRPSLPRIPAPRPDDRDRPRTREAAEQISFTNRARALRRGFAKVAARRPLDRPPIAHGPGVAGPARTDRSVCRTAGAELLLERVLPAAPLFGRPSSSSRR